MRTAKIGPDLRLILRKHSSSQIETRHALVSKTTRANEGRWTWKDQIYLAAVIVAAIKSINNFWPVIIVRVFLLKRKETAPQGLTWDLGSYLNPKCFD